MKKSMISRNFPDSLRLAKVQSTPVPSISFGSTDAPYWLMAAGERRSRWLDSRRHFASVAITIEGVQ